MIRKINLKSSLFLFLIMCCMSTAFGQKGDSYDPATTNYFIQNVTVIQKPGVSLEGQNILIQDGMIKEMGSNLKKPANVKLLKWDSLYVYAGFIDAFSNTGVPASKPEAQGGQRGGNRQQGSQVKRYNPTNKQAGITPEVSISNLLNGKDKSISAWRGQGFTASHSVPRGNFLPGKGSVILLKDAQDKNEIIVKEDCSLYSNLRGSRPVYPSTVIAVMSKWRVLYTNAALSAKHQKKYANDPSGMSRPQPDAATKALYDLVDGNLHLFAQADNASNINKVINLQQELDYPMVIAGIKDPGPALDMLKGKDYPLVLSLDMPEQPKELKKAKKGKEDKAEDKDKKEDKSKSIYSEQEMKMLTERKIEAYNNMTSFPSKLSATGKTFSFGTMGTKAKDFKGNLNMMIEQGLDKDKALASLTTEPAKLLGVDKVMGTVEKGKLANLVVTDKPFFDEGSSIKYVMVDGQKFEFKSKAKKKKSEAKSDESGSKSELQGTWAYTISIPTGEERSGNFSFSKDGDSYTGKISSDDLGSEYMDLENVEVDGNGMTCTFELDMEGNQMTAKISVTINGDEMVGTFTLSAFGSMPIEAEKTSNTPN